ncbi:winged helix-turn-helix transcriptional regulator [Flavobacterium bizetiae]|uniref:winged helix-turn-helix transcriptional regulator n=1 Tax=Flavobacterium bizetiae TaxID=2704140 RepID=UPI00375685EF
MLNSLCTGPKRFTELRKEVIGITDKTLDRDLKKLQTDKLISRQVQDSTPVLIEYQITDHWRSLNKVLYELLNWGLSHRKEVIG